MDARRCSQDYRPFATRMISSRDLHPAPSVLITLNAQPMTCPDSSFSQMLSAYIRVYRAFICVKPCPPTLTENHCQSIDGSSAEPSVVIFRCANRQRGRGWHFDLQYTRFRWECAQC